MADKTDLDIVEDFLRDTMKPDSERDLHDEFMTLMRGKRPDEETLAISFAIYATARSAIKGMLEREKTLQIIDHKTGAVEETESIPNEVEMTMRSASMVIALGRDEQKFSPMYYVMTLLNLISAEENEELANVSKGFRSESDRIVLAAIDNVRKGKHIVPDTTN